MFANEEWGDFVKYYIRFPILFCFVVKRASCQLRG